MAQFIRRVLGCLIMSILAIGTITNGYADDLTFLRVQQFRSYRGVNPIDWAKGDRLILSIHVSPFFTTTYGWTNVQATNVATGYSMNIPYVGGSTPSMQTEFGASITYDASLTGEWTITATNGPESVITSLPALGDVEKVPLVYNVELIGIGLTPTISWKMPFDSDVDHIRISIIDFATRLRLFWSPCLTPQTTQYTIPSDLLEESNQYVFRVIIEDAVNDIFCARTASRSECFFGPFTPLASGGPNSVLLPTVGTDPDLNDIFAAEFTFDCDVAVGESIFLDPPVAIGYDFKIGLGDTVKFLTLTLPEVGDNLFGLYLFDGSGFYRIKEDLMAGETFAFGLEGVGAFRVLGIDEEAELDPKNTTAFITEVTFTESGKFTGTMTPLIAYPVTVDLHPETLNLKSRGKYVTCYLELPLDFDVGSIHVGSVMLEINGSTIPAELSPTGIGDYDSDSIPDLMVKFDRGAVQDVVTLNEVEVKVTGSIFGCETNFQGVDTIFVIDKGKDHFSEDHGSVVQ